MLKRELAGRGPAEGGQAMPSEPVVAEPAAAADGRPSGPPSPDRGERRLGWFAVAIAIAVVVVLAATLSMLPRFGGSADLSAQREAATDVGPLGAASGTASGTPAGLTNQSAPEPQPANPGGSAEPAGFSAPAGPGATAGPHATAAPSATGGPQSTAVPAPSVSPPPTAQAAIADLRAEIGEQAYAGRLDLQAGLDLLDKVDQIAHEVSGGQWAAARDLVHKMRDKLDKLRHDGLLTSTGYQALIARVDVLDKALV